MCKTPEKGSLFQFLPFSQSLGERQQDVYCEDFWQKGLTTMYQLLGPLSTSKEKVLTSRCHVSQLFSQWAISTGEKGPKNFWGLFFYFHLKLWKVLTQAQLPAKNFSKTSRSKKKNLSFIESNTTVDFTYETLAIDDTHGDDVRGGDWGAGHGG